MGILKVNANKNSDIFFPLSRWIALSTRGSTHLSLGSMGLGDDDNVLMALPLPGFCSAFRYSTASVAIFIKCWFLLLPSSENFGAPGCPGDRCIACLTFRALRVLP